MKKTLLVLMVLICAITVFAFASCSKDAETDNENQDSTHSAHFYNSGKVVTAPTCTAVGKVERECYCGAKTVDDIPAIGHTWAEATCVAPKTCVVCKETEGEVGDHTPTVIKGVQATCKKTGLTDGVQCSVCEKVFTAQVETPLAHNSVVVPGYAPTCTKSGLSDGAKCGTCKITLIKRTELPATGHTEMTVGAVAPTCTETGLTEGIKCADCDYIYKAQEVVPAAGHKYETVPQVDPTCVKEGKTESVVCSVCNDVKSGGEVISATGHSFDNNICTSCGAATPSQKGEKATKADWDKSMNANNFASISYPTEEPNKVDEISFDGDLIKLDSNYTDDAMYVTKDGVQYVVFSDGYGVALKQPVFTCMRDTFFLVLGAIDFEDLTFNEELGCYECITKSNLYVYVVFVDGYIVEAFSSPLDSSSIFKSSIVFFSDYGTTDLGEAPEFEIIELN